MPFAPVAVFALKGTGALARAQVLRIERGLIRFGALASSETRSWTALPQPQGIEPTGGDGGERPATYSLERASKLTSRVVARREALRGVAGVPGPPVLAIARSSQTWPPRTPGGAAAFSGFLTERHRYASHPPRPAAASADLHRGFGQRC